MKHVVLYKLLQRCPQETQTQVTEVETNQGNKAKIYIGHEKEDYEGRRTGKPGRFIEDDPTLYPGKEDVGFLAGATGGWAGGEAGLKQFIEEVAQAVCFSGVLVYHFTTTTTAITHTHSTKRQRHLHQRRRPPRWRPKRWCPLSQAKRPP